MAAGLVASASVLAASVSPVSVLVVEPLDSEDESLSVVDEAESQLAPVVGATATVFGWADDGMASTRVMADEASARGEVLAATSGRNAVGSGEENAR